MSLTIAGTGHRPNKLGGYSPEVFSTLVGVAKDALIEVQPTKVISGMALGWDTALAVAARELNIPFIAAVPFFEQPSAWPQASQDMYHGLLASASDVVYVCDKGYAPWKMQIRNEWMVDHCDVVLALWDGTSGGTGNCIAYADKVKKPIHNIWDKFKGDSR